MHHRGGGSLARGNRGTTRRGILRTGPGPRTARRHESGREDRPTSRPDRPGCVRGGQRPDDRDLQPRGDHLLRRQPPGHRADRPTVGRGPGTGRRDRSRGPFVHRHRPGAGQGRTPARGHTLPGRDGGRGDRGHGTGGPTCLDHRRRTEGARCQPQLRTRRRRQHGPGQPGDRNPLVRFRPRPGLGHGPGRSRRLRRPRRDPCRQTLSRPW